MQAVDLTVEPRGQGGIWLLKDGEGPSVIETYPPPDGRPTGHGRDIMAFYWGPGPAVWVSSAELDRLIGLAAGKREPFAARVAVVPPVTGLRPVDRFAGEDFKLEWLDEDLDDEVHLCKVHFCRLVRRTAGGGAAKACQ
jgi:hypothetical protein